MYFYFYPTLWKSVHIKISKELINVQVGVSPLVKYLRFHFFMISNMHKINHQIYIFNDLIGV